MDTSTIALAVDTRQVRTAESVLDDLVKTLGLTESATTSLEGSLRQMASATGAVRAPATSAAAALKQIADESKRPVGGGMAELGKQTKLTAYQTQQLSFQLHDFFVQVASGQSALTAAVQQGSQLSGTFGSAGGALRAVASLFTPLSAGALAAAAAIGGIAFAAHQGAQESANLQKYLALTGNSAGITAGQFDAAAESVAASTRTTIGSTRATLQTLVESGRLTAETLSSTAAAAQLFAKVTGASAEDASKEFVSLASNVTKGANTLNDKYHFLTAAQLDQIKTLDEQGRSQQALLIVTTALTARLQSAADKMSTLDQSTQGASNAMSGLVDWFKALGRESTAEGRIAAVMKQLEAFDKRTGTLLPADQARRDALEARLKLLQKEEAAGQQAAKTAGETVKREQARTALLGLQDRYLTKQQQMAKELKTAATVAIDAGASPAELQALQASIRRKYADDTKGQLDNQLAALARQFSTEQALLATRNRFLDLANDQALISLRDYYAAKKTANDEATQSEVANLDKQIALAQQAKAGADPERRIEIERKIADATAKRAEVIRRGADDNTAAALQEGKAVGELARMFRTLDAAVLDTRGSLTAAAAIRFDDQNEAIRKRAEAEGNTGALAQLATLRELTIRQAAYNELQQGYTSELAAELVARDAIQKAQLTSLALSDREADALLRLTAEEVRYQGELKRLQEARNAGQISEAAYEIRLAAQRKFHTDSLALEAAYQADLAKKQADMGEGARRALANYADQAGKAGDATASAITRGLSMLEDDLSSGLAKGKLDLSSFVDFARTELLKLTVIRPLLQSITGALANSLGGGAAGGGGYAGLIGSAIGAFSGGGAGAGGGVDYSLPTSGVKFGTRAIGGPVSAGGLYQVNERRTELLDIGGRQYLMAGQNGTVKDTATAAPVQPINIHLNGPVPREQVALVKSVVAQELNRAGRNRRVRGDD